MVGLPIGWAKGSLTKTGAGNKSLPDSLLVECARRGSHQAFELLVLRYRHRIRGVVGRIIRSEEDASDVLQEAFLKAYQAIEKFRGDSAFYTWLYRIAINTAMNHVSSQAGRPLYESCSQEEFAGKIDSSPGLVHNESPELVLLSEEVKQDLSHVLEGLPDELRLAITLREVNGMCYKEIAKVMDCPVGTVRSRIFRARQALRACGSSAR